MEPKFTLYIPIELKNRELASQVALATKAAELGIRTYIGTHFTIHTLLNYKPGVGGIYLDKGTLPVEKMQWLKSRCDGIVILDQELGPTEDNPLSALAEWPGRIYPHAVPFIDRYYCVGDFVYQSALHFFRESQRPGVPRLTGWPRIDLWKLGSSKLQIKRVAKIKKKYGKFLLYTSSFGWLNEKAIDQDIKNSNKYQMTWDQQKAHFEILSNFRDTVEALRAWDANLDVPNIVVRPHISESKGLWKSSLGNVNKTHIVHAGNVADWILASEGVIHEGSTVALEAHIRKKSVYFLDHESKYPVKKLPFALSEFVVSREQHPYGSKNSSRLKSNADTEFLVKSRVFSDEATSIGLILNDLNDLWQTKEVKISRASYVFKSLRLRSLRRIIGLMKWELLSKLRLTLSSPPSRTIGVFLRRKEFEDSINLIDSPHKVVLRRIAINLWEISIDKF